MRVWGVAAALVGCADPVVASEFESSNLENARVTPSIEVVGRVDTLGTIGVEEDGGGWSFSVATPDTWWSVEVVSPGGGNPMPFDGLPGRLAVAQVPGTREYSVALYSPEGEVSYLLEPVVPGALTEAGFGPGLLGQGNDLGEVERSGWAVGLRSAWLRTDGVDLELLPGEPRGVWLRHNVYRVVLMSSWELLHEGTGCDVPAARLAYEVVRTEGSIDEEPLVRDPSVPLVDEACAAD